MLYVIQDGNVLKDAHSSGKCTQGHTIHYSLLKLCNMGKERSHRTFATCWSNHDGVPS